MPSLLADNCTLFEYLLKIDEEGCAITYEQLVTDLRKFSDITMDKLVTPQSVSMSHKKRWEQDARQMLGYITMSFIKHLGVECYNCPCGTEDVKSVAHLKKVCAEYLLMVQYYHSIVLLLIPVSTFQLQLDHLINWFKKWKSVSKVVIASTPFVVREIIMEALKCRLICKFCHLHGIEEDQPEYYNRLAEPNELKYSRLIFGGNHRTVTQVFEERTVASLMLDLKVRGAMIDRDCKITFKTVKTVVWMHLRILCSDLRKEDETSVFIHSAYCSVLVKELVKMLGVECPSTECHECFLNRRSVTRSGIELNHMKPSSKLNKPGKLFRSTTLKREIKEAKEGMLHPICVGHHEEVTAFQNKMTKRPSWYVGN